MKNSTTNLQSKRIFIIVLSLFIIAFQHLIAQENKENKKSGKNTVKLKIIKEVNGNKTVIDTTFESDSDDPKFNIVESENDKDEFLPKPRMYSKPFNYNNTFPDAPLFLERKGETNDFISRNENVLDSLMQGKSYTIDEQGNKIFKFTSNANFDFYLKKLDKDNSYLFHLNPSLDIKNGTAFNFNLDDKILKFQFDSLQNQLFINKDSINNMMFYLQDSLQKQFKNNQIFRFGFNNKNFRNFNFNLPHSFNFGHFDNMDSLFNMNFFRGLKGMFNLHGLSGLRFDSDSLYNDLEIFTPNTEPLDLFDENMNIPDNNSDYKNQNNEIDKDSFFKDFSKNKFESKTITIETRGDSIIRKEIIKNGNDEPKEIIKVYPKKNANKFTYKSDDIPKSKKFGAKVTIIDADKNEKQEKKLEELYKKDEIANTLNVENFSFSFAKNNKFNLSFNLKERGNTVIKIKDINGNELYNETLKSFKGPFSKDLSIKKQTDGIYIVVINQDSKKFEKKVIIK